MVEKNSKYVNGNHEGTYANKFFLIGGETHGGRVCT
jgi:hypothetical protein